MTALELKLLGDFALSGAESTHLPTRKAEALMAYLSMPAGRVHRRERLAALLWGTRSDANARHSLAQSLHLIRRTLGRNGATALVTDDRSVALAPSAIKIDVTEFENLLAQRSIAALTQAIDVYRGQFLDNIAIGEVEFEDWRHSEQERLRNAALGAMETLLRHLFDSDKTTAAIDLARRFLAIDPLNEAVHRSLMRLYCRTGRNERALRQFQRCTAILKRELGVNPEAETIALHRELLNRRTDPGSATSDGNRGIAAASVMDRPLVAIIPFNNISGDADQEYFSDGITEDLIAALSRLRSFDVIARGAINAYKGDDYPISLIARQLSVRYIVQGTVRKLARRARITAHLIDAATGKQLWTDNYDRALRNIFEVQDEIVSSIVHALGAADGAIEQLERRKRVENTTDTGSAYDHYLRGRHYFYRHGDSEFERAEECYLRAIELDADFSPAYSALAWQYFVQFKLFRKVGFNEIRSKAVDLAVRALQLNRQEFRAHWVLGGIYLHDGQHDQSIAEFDKAIRINPNDANLLSFSAEALVYAGRLDEAVERCDHALRINPDCPDWYHWIRASALFHQGRYADALVALNRMSTAGYAGKLKAAVYAYLGETDKATSEARDYMKLVPAFSIREWAQSERYADPRELQRYTGGMRRAGIPD